MGLFSCHWKLSYLIQGNEKKIQTEKSELKSYWYRKVEWNGPRGWWHEKENSFQEKKIYLKDIDIKGI